MEFTQPPEVTVSQRNANNQIFHPTDAAILEVNSLISREHEGRRLISTPVLFLSASPNASEVVQFSKLAFESIPSRLTSLEALEFAGFDSLTSTFLWHAWQTGVNTGNTTLKSFPEFTMDYLYGVVEARKARERGRTGNPYPEPEEDWEMIFYECGISSIFIRVIMSREWAAERRGQTPSSWAMGCIMDRFKDLERIKRSSDIRAQEACLAASKKYVPRERDKEILDRVEVSQRQEAARISILKGKGREKGVASDEAAFDDSGPSRERERRRRGSLL